MRLLARIAAIVRGWLHAGALDAELAEELRFHLDQQTLSNIDAGMTPEAARRAALLAFGSVDAVRDESRAARPGAWWRQAGHDLVFGTRLLRRTPGFTITSTAVIALGIGTTTAIFSVVHGIVLQPPPFEQPERLVALWTRLPESGQRARANAADHRAWLSSTTVFEDVALAGGIQNFNLTGVGEPERLFAARMSANVFAVLGVSPALGRTFTGAEEAPGNDRVVVLSDGLWRRRFGADPSIVGRTINLNGAVFEVIGVMRPDFHYPGREHQLWIPLAINPAVLSRQLRTYDHLAIARLKPGASRQRAQAEMDAIARRLETDHPATNRGVRFEVLPLLEESIRGVRPTLYLMLAAVSCLLIIACLNLAGLVGTRAASREREFTVRRALGASHARLTLQALAEVAPVLALGGLAGIAGARVAIAGFVPIAPATLPRVESIAVNGPVLAFSIGILLLTGLAAGLLPATHAWRSTLPMTPRAGRSSTATRDHTRTRSLLVVAQFALTLPLLVAGTALVRSFTGLMSVDPGFRPENVLSMHLAVSRSTYRNDAQVAAFCSRVVERVAALPGVLSAGMVNRLPLSGNNQVMTFEFEEAGGGPLPVQSRTATSGYFRTMSIPLREGRLFTASDDSSAALVSLVDERLAGMLWPGQSAIGKRYRITLPGQQTRRAEIVGVVGNVRHGGLDVENDRQVYFHHPQFTDGRMVLVTRTSYDAAAAAPAVVRAIREIDADQPVYDVRPMKEVVARSAAERWLNTALVTMFAVSALLLAGVGLYGVSACSVNERVREFGVRLALGATRTDLSLLVLRKGLALAAGGAAAGLVGAAALILSIRKVLDQLAPLDPVAFAVASTLLVAVALVASYLPARRAALTDPAVTLRAE
jgi:predicted permease